MIIIRRFFLSFLIITTGLPGIAQLLYQIDGNGLKQPSYLYGTIHLIPKDKFKLEKNVKNAIRNAEVLALEIDMNMSLKMMMDLAKQMTLPENKTIRDYLKEDDFARLRSHCIDTIGIKEKKFNSYIRFKPFFMSALLLKHQLGKTVSYEEHFNKMAKKQKMKSIGLESIHFQMETIDKISIEEQIASIMEGLGTEMQEYYHMVDLYLKEDLKALHQYTLEESESMPDFLYHFLELRNRNWIPVIEENISKASVFIAVGAGHLEGESGVIQLLRERGFRVEPLFAD